MKIKEVESKAKVKIEIKIEYTGVKTEPLDSKVIEGSVNKKNLQTDKEVPLKDTSNSVILDLLKKNVAKYEDTSKVTYKKANQSSIKRTHDLSDSKEKKKKLKIEQTNNLETKKEYKEVEFELKQEDQIKIELWGRNLMVSNSK